MSISKKQLKRLLKIAAQLKENRYPNCSTIVEGFRKLDIENNMNIACSAKTVRRDIKTLKEDFNCPVEFDWAKNGYYLKHHGWNFDCPILFDEHEMLPAVLGARLAEEIFPEPLRSYIRQAVDYQLTYNNPDFLDKAIINSLAVIPGLKTNITAETFMAVFNCWQNHQVLEIKYQAIDDLETIYPIEPHALVYCNTSWYTKARCLPEGDIRDFALHHIVSATAQEKYFTPDNKIINDLNNERFPEYDEIKNIKIICDFSISDHLETNPLHKDQNVKKLNNQQLLLTLPSTSKHEITKWILYQSGKAQLLEPVSLKTEIRKIAQNIKNIH